MKKAKQPDELLDAMDQKRLAAVREARNLKKHLRDLSGAVSLGLNRLDAEMAKPPSPERGSNIAKISNALNQQNDIALRFGLGKRS